MNLMEVDDGGEWNIVDNTTGMYGHVSPIKTFRAYIYILYYNWEVAIENR